MICSSNSSGRDSANVLRCVLLLLKLKLVSSCKEDMGLIAKDLMTDLIEGLTAGAWIAICDKLGDVAVVSRDASRGSDTVVGVETGNL